MNWSDLEPYSEKMTRLLALIKKIGLSNEVSQPCLIAETMMRTYQLSISKADLRPFYKDRYDKAVEKLRDSVRYFQKSPNSYVSSFHQFTHITLIAFCEYVLPSEQGILTSYYNNLINRGSFKEKCPISVSTLDKLNNLRNRVEHPIDRKTESHSKNITVQEIESLRKQLKGALQDIFDSWLSLEIDENDTATSDVSVLSVETTTETIEKLP